MVGALGASVVVAVLALSALGSPTTPAGIPSATGTSSGVGAATAPAATATPDAVLTADVDAASVADRVIPSVVYVEVLRGAPAGQTAAVASGSGVVIDTEGHIVTNRHVVAAGTAYRVVLSDGRTYGATLIGVDEATDLAVLGVSADGLTPIAMGSSDALGVGDPAVAVGSPLGLQGGPSLTVGVVSAFGREVTTDSSTLYGMLQTDAAITEGSSGGALVDEAGRLIGITTAVGVSSVGVEGIGFATPVEIVERVAGELLTDGVATQAGLGITGETAYRAMADGGERPVGVEILAIRAGSAASDAGLAVGDVISEVAATPVDTMDELIAALRRHAAGDRVSLAVDGGGVSRTVEVALQDL
ncbi:MAG TPA: trypsin-like peptidase domain-containing protein [Candidatus Limnocylindrales bacterium]|nr:trypsin-like peptidase domain-containing protein [Candidatus Limnocylindrales bacterium]